MRLPGERPGGRAVRRRLQPARRGRRARSREALHRQWTEQHRRGHRGGHRVGDPQRRTVGAELREGRGREQERRMIGDVGGAQHRLRTALAAEIAQPRTMEDVTVQRVREIVGVVDPAVIEPQQIDRRGRVRPHPPVPVDVQHRRAIGLEISRAVQPHPGGGQGAAGRPGRQRHAAREASAAGRGQGGQSLHDAQREGGGPRSAARKRQHQNVALDPRPQRRETALGGVRGRRIGDARIGQRDASAEREGAYQKAGGQAASH